MPCVAEDSQAMLKQLPIPKCAEDAARLEWLQAAYGAQGENSGRITSVEQTGTTADMAKIK